MVFDLLRSGSVMASKATLQYRFYPA